MEPAVWLKSFCVDFFDAPQNIIRESVALYSDLARVLMGNFGHFALF
jgi:hypothetical protein